MTVTIKINCFVIQSNWNRGKELDFRMLHARAKVMKINCLSVYDGTVFCVIINLTILSTLFEIVCFHNINKQQY